MKKNNADNIPLTATKPMVCRLAKVSHLLRLATPR